MPKAIPCELWHTVHIEPHYIPFFFNTIHKTKTICNFACLDLVKQGDSRKNKCIPL